MEHLNCLSPLDSRYSSNMNELKNYFSYESWIKYRVDVELRYFKFLYNNIDELKDNIHLNKVNQFTNQSIDVSEILDIENNIFHDIKAIEVYLKN